jgi:hypothetical protein
VKKITFVNIIFILITMKKSSVILMWGVITAIVSALFKEFTYNLSNNIQLLGLAIFIAGLIIGTFQYRNKTNGGYGSFGNLYGFGMLLSLVIGVFGIIHVFIFNSMHPDFVSSALEKSRAMMVMQNASDQQIEMGMRIKRFFLESPVGIIVGGIIGSALFGAIFSLLSSAIAARPKPLIEEDNTTA